MDPGRMDLMTDLAYDNVMARVEARPIVFRPLKKKFVNVFFILQIR
jgi:hypothetical protein